MPKIDRTATPTARVAVASRFAETRGAGLAECAIVSIGGLAVALMLIANGLFPAELLTVLQ